MDGRWYEELRAAYRPAQVRLLLVGESAPDPRSAERRFFYAPTLAAADNLFRGVVEGLYGHRFPPGSAGSSKSPWLDGLCDDGVFLIDLVPFPVNGLPNAERARARREHAEETVTIARRLEPSGIVICHAPTFHVLAPRLREAGLPLLHEAPLPFPLGNTRAKFVAGLRPSTERLLLDRRRGRR